MDSFTKKAPKLGGRGGTIGGTSWGPLLGMSRFKTPHDVWLRMKGLEEPIRQNAAMRRGIRLEPVISGIAAAYLGLELKIPSRETVYWPKPYKSFSASVDRDAYDAGRYLGPVELKTMSAWSEWGECGPPEYRLQLQSYIWQRHLASMAKGGSPVDAGWLVCVQASDEVFKMCRNPLDVEHAISVGAAALHSHQFPRDPVFIKKVVPYAEWWIKAYVSGDTPPPCDGSNASLLALHRHYGFEGESSVELSRDAEALAQTYVEACDAVTEANRVKKDAEQKRDTAKAALLDVMQGATTGVGESLGVQVKMSRGTMLDTRALKEELPDIVAKYQKPRAVSVRVKVEKRGAHD